MEKGIERLILPEDKTVSYAPLGLAYIGDAVHALYVRCRLLEEGDKRVHDLHELTSRHVKAAAQSKTIFFLMQKLTEEEVAIYKRGRNAKSYTVPKHADVADYRHATGFEALIGYLYMKGNKERLEDLLARSYEFITMEEKQCLQNELQK